MDLMINTSANPEWSSFMLVINSFQVYPSLGVNKGQISIEPHFHQANKVSETGKNNME